MNRSQTMKERALAGALTFVPRSANSTVRTVAVVRSVPAAQTVILCVININKNVWLGPVP